MAVAQRYRGLLKLIGRKTIQSLLNLAEKLQTDKQLYRKQWYPDPEEQTILAKIPLKELDISRFEAFGFSRVALFSKTVATA